MRRPSRAGLLSGLLASTLTVASQIPQRDNDNDNDFRPSKDMARLRAPEIFNAVHNAMRQWGSSLHHNGMSFFLATVPEGVLFHHGTHQPEPPTDPEWLAYEIEHAELFARPWRRRPGTRPRPPPDTPGSGFMDTSTSTDGSQAVMMSDVQKAEYKHDDEDEDEDEDEDQHGYLHIYQTTRPMQFLYIDGMGAGKTAMGTLDTQDFLLRGQEPSDGNPDNGRRGMMDERQRAAELCELCGKWGLQGVIRMEAGFEIIKCDFSDGLEQLDVLQRPSSKGDDGPPGMANLEYFRGVSERYQGIGAGRTSVDFSSMVSAFFFPLNLTNPNPHRPDLPRLSSTSRDELAAIKHHLAHVLDQRRAESPKRGIDWQDVSDLLVGRYADRIKYMAEEVGSIELMAREVNFLLTVFIDHSGPDTDLSAAQSRCVNYYLRTVRPDDPTDYMIETAFRTMVREICGILFRVRELVVVDPEASSLEESVSSLRGLMDFLGWARFKRCPACGIGEVCVIPMWPMGTVDMYVSPRCTNGSARDGEYYWTAPGLEL